MNYSTNVTWDASLADVWFSDTQNEIQLKGLAFFALKVTAGAPSAIAERWLPGATVVNVVTGITYKMTGSTASPAWTATAAVPGTVSQVQKVTTGTTPVNVFGNPSGVAGTILSVSVTALDATAGNIVVKDTAGTVATVAKGTTVGVTTGATTIANAAFTAAGILTVESSTAGNAIVTITYTPA